MMVEARRRVFHRTDGDARNRRFTFIVPGYHEGENINAYLAELKDQMDVGDERDWGFTFVFDYAAKDNPGWRKRGERGPHLTEVLAVKEMTEAIEEFRRMNPRYADRIDYVFFRRNPDAKNRVLPVALARNVGEDVL